MIDWTLAGARLLQFASTLVLFGSAAFVLYGYRRAGAHEPASEPAPAWIRTLLLWASVVGVASSLAWLLAEAVALTGTWTSWRDVLSGTRLGRVLALRAGLLACAVAVCATLQPKRRLCVAAAILGGVSTASFAWTGHGSMGAGSGGEVHLAADVLHLLVAGFWIGALVPMSILSAHALRSRSMIDAADSAQALVRFSVFGATIVLLLIVSGLVNGWFLVGVEQWRALFRTAYGIALLLKLVMFGLMLALAWKHRYRTAPALRQVLVSGADASPILGQLRVTMVAETLIAFLVLADVALLGTLEPPVAL